MAFDAEKKQYKTSPLFSPEKCTRVSSKSDLMTALHYIYTLVGVVA